MTMITMGFYLVRTNDTACANTVCARRIALRARLGCDASFSLFEFLVFFFNTIHGSHYNI